MTLSDAELDRYARHIVLKEIGGAGQARLKAATVAVIGAGGIGSPAIQYLAAAGVGRLRVIDDDRVDHSNLQRQTLFGEADVGALKVEAAEAAAARLNPAVAVEPVAERIDAGNAARLLDGAEVVLDGCDNFTTRLAVSDACVSAGVPLVSAAVGRFQGQVAAFAGHLANQPCYRCYVGDAFDADDCDSCADDGMLGAMAGWAGTFAALQAVRVVLQGIGPLGDPQWGRLHLLDGLAPAMRTIAIPKDPACRGCGESSARV